MSMTSVMHAELLKKPNMFQRSTKCVSPKSEEISGEVILVGPGNLRRYVHIKVYRTSLEHFAVVYPLSKISRPLGVINLRNTDVETIPSSSTSDPNQTGFLIKQKVFDTTTCLTVLCDSSTNLDAWLNALSNNRHSTSCCMQQSSLPIVEEEDD